MAEHNDIQFKFDNITFISKTLNEQPINYQGQHDVVHDISVDLKINPDDEIIGVFPRVVVKTQDDFELAKIEIICGFKVTDFKTALNAKGDKEYRVPIDLQRILITVSVSTLRGLLYSHLQGTYLMNTIMPVVFFDLPISNTTSTPAGNEMAA